MRGRAVAWLGDRDLFRRTDPRNLRNETAAAELTKAISCGSGAQQDRDGSASRPSNVSLT